jgi:cytoskeletal protein CcmA (bactofilin family)
MPGLSWRSIKVSSELSVNGTDRPDGPRKILGMSARTEPARPTHPAARIGEPCIVITEHLMSTVTDSSREPASILGSTLRFKGELRADEDVLIKGHVEGSIVHSKRLTICSEGHVKANIDGQIVIVEGTVEGDMTAAVSVGVIAGAKVTGDIRAPSVNIVDGAYVNGSVAMKAAEPARTMRPSGIRPVSGVASDVANAVKDR